MEKFCSTILHILSLHFVWHIFGHLQVMLHAYITITLANKLSTQPVRSLNII